MATWTLANLRTEVRRRADIETSQYVKDPELTNYINSSIAELYDVLTQKFGNDYFLNTYTFNLVNGQAAYNLPVTFFKSLGVDIKVSAANEYQTLRRYEFNERNRYNASLLRGVYGSTYLRYRIQGNQINFTPTPTSTEEIRLFYIPLPTTLSADGDTFDGYNGWEEYVIVDAAIKCLEKEESDTRALQARKAMLNQRIESAAGNRDAGFSPRITNTQRIDFEQGNDPWAY